MMETPVLEGYGVRLEPVCEAHRAQFERIALEPSIWHYMPLKLEAVADVHAWMRDAMEKNASSSFQIWSTMLEGGEIVGSTRLFDLNEQHRTGEIGFTWLTAPWRGSGLNPRVKLLQLTHAFESLGLRRVALKTHHANLRSQRGILKLGAKYEGTFRNHMIMPDGSARHTLWYSIVAEEWPAVKSALLERVATTPLAALPAKSTRSAVVE